MTKTDQNGSVHTYTYDSLGRLTADTCSTPGSGVDTAIQRIATAYNLRGQVVHVVSYNVPNTLVNDTQWAYNAFGQVTSEYQEHCGAVNTSTTLKVGYDYTDGASNHVRRTQTVYPNGRILHYGYDSGMDNLLSRVSYLADDSSGSAGQHLAEYDYLGVGGIVRVTYPLSSSDSIRWGLLGGSSSNPYERMDWFGRITDQIWSHCTTTPTDLVRIQHAYDRAGNRLWRRDRVASAAGKALDELYSYDGMNQLTELQRGRLTTARDGLRPDTKTFGETWSLDMTGNWTAYSQDADGDGAWDLVQTRTHTKANEIAGITGGSWVTPVHDRAGNMTTVPQPNAPTTAYTCTYDAWNRLVKVVDASTSNTVAEYVYDGRNFRIVKKTYASGTLSETRHYYYNGAWQLLEERLSSGSTLSSYADRQHVWGLRYIDDLVLRDRNADSNTSTGSLGKTGSGLEERLYALHDANWNVVALVNATGDVVERYVYDAYGKMTIYEGAWLSTRSASAHSNETTYTGRQYDPETGFLYCRYRYLDSRLGRFLSRDPIEYESSQWNLYEYVGGAPTKYADPLGLDWSCFPWATYCPPDYFPPNVLPIPPYYSPDFWNDAYFFGLWGGTIQYSNNCYSYACNRPYGPDGRPRPQGKPQPGGGLVSVDCVSLNTAAMSDGLTKPCKGKCPDHWHKVHGFVDRGAGDYHWYRQDANGYWSHKPGWGDVTNVDASGTLITDPIAADRDYRWVDYKEDCGELCAPD